MPVPDPIAASRDRARVYRALAHLFRSEQALDALRSVEVPEMRRALERLGDAPSLDEARHLAARLAELEPEQLRQGYEQTFEASGGLRCPPHETTLAAATPQEALVRTFEMADVAGFYRAFGVEVTPGTERPDHVAAELEFMHLLAVKEATAYEEADDGEHVAICRDAARAFLRDHLGRLAPRLVERLEENAAEPLYAAAGRLLDRFVTADATRLGAT